ncbi:hypothetical protein J6590_103401 [Homalodisca vitripennis]|nr:hypothetical protein J6590_103401 [Homalodisca vitripennis]
MFPDEEVPEEGQEIDRNMQICEGLIRAEKPIRTSGQPQDVSMSRDVTAMLVSCNALYLVRDNISTAQISRFLSINFGSCSISVILPRPSGSPRSKDRPEHCGWPWRRKDAAKLHCSCPREGIKYFSIHRFHGTDIK